MFSVAHLLTSAACRCRSMRELKQIQSQAIASGLSHHHLLLSKLLLFSASSDSGDLDYAHLLFGSIRDPNTFSWNAIIRGCARGRDPNRALAHFVRMLRLEVPPDHVTFPFLAKSCARLASRSLGTAVHCWVVKSGVEVDLFVGNSLVHMYGSCGDIGSAREVFDGIAEPNVVSWNAMLDGYAKCGNMSIAREVFDRMPKKDIVSWSALIDGYVKKTEYEEALAVFGRMEAEGPRANTVTMVSVLSACAHLGALDQGRRMHWYVQDNDLSVSLPLATSLVDMYAKCGSIAEALMVFHAVPPSETDVLIWNAMIGGFAMHGLSEESLGLFRKMQAFGVLPDEITYLSLLSACAHGGRVEDAWCLFRSFKAQGMTPHIEHYACMVDVLGRSGQIDEAFEFVRSVPIEPSASVLGALLSGCQTHRRVELAEDVAKKLIELKPYEDGRYIGLSNVYASARRWNDAGMARRAMEERGVKKAAGCSLVEVGGKLHGFSAHDKSHPQAIEIYKLLSFLLEQMKTDFELFISVGDSLICPFCL